jgi:hypothetical protein
MRIKLRDGEIFLNKFRHIESISSLTSNKREGEYKRVYHFTEIDQYKTCLSGVKIKDSEYLQACGMEILLINSVG